LRQSTAILAQTIVLTAVLSPAVANDEVPNESAAIKERIESELRHAESYYWFGMAEQGNMVAFDSGFRHLENVKSLAESDSIRSEDRARYLQRVEALDSDLKEQAEIAHDTLYGVFPLFRFVTRSIFAESTSAGTFEVLDDPTVMASTSAAKKLALEVVQKWTNRPHLDVAFCSVPHNPQLENEALYLFNMSPKFFVHNSREIVDALNDEQFAEFQAGNITPAVKDQLLDAFDQSELMVVYVNETDIIEDDYFYTVEGRIFDKPNDEPIFKLAVMGFSRDRSAQFRPMLIANNLLLVISVVAFWFMSKLRLRAGVAVSSTAAILIPLLGFGMGRCMAWFIAPFLKSISQIPETLAIASFWLPSLAGLAFLIVPMLAFWLVSKRLAKFFSLFKLDGRLAPAFVAVAAGAVAYLAAPAFLYLESDAVAILVPLTIGATSLGYLLGRAWDVRDRIPMALGFLPMVLSFAMGGALFSCSVEMTWVWAGLATSFAGVVIVPSLTRSRIATGGKATAEAAVDVTPADLVVSGKVDPKHLGEVVERPKFCKFAAHDKASKVVAPSLEGTSVHLGIFGEGGSGVSATARMVLEDLIKSLEKKGREVERMYAECPPATGEPIPFAPFRQALARHFETDLLGAAHSKTKQIDSALGAVFGSVVPFAGVLLPGSTEMGSRSFSSSEEIFRSIAMILRRASKQKTLVLFIDDAQWMDNSSKSLLSHLLGEFPVGGPEPVIIVVASQGFDALSSLGGEIAEKAIKVPYPTVAEQVRILTNGVGLTKATAEQVVDRLGAGTMANGGLFWLLQVVANFARAGVFVRTAQGLAMPDNKWPEGVDVPDEIRDVLRTRLSEYPQYRQLLVAAACACEGREFTATHVAVALGRSRLDVLTDLDYLDRETSVLSDVLDRDDVFAFPSVFMLEVVREELRVAERGPATANVPQLVREYHFRLAEYFRESLNKDSRLLYRVATHYYAAGSAHAETAMRYCVEAATAASGVLDFEAAGRYLECADECAKVVGRPDAIEAERLYLACRKANLSGDFRDQNRVARMGLKHLEDHRDSPIRLMFVVGQLHYELGKATGQREYFDRALSIGRRIIEDAKTPRDRAIGRLVVGCSLPSSDRKRREEVLRSAMELIEPLAGHDAADTELLGRIIGSLADELSQQPENHVEAKKLYEFRLQFNERHRLCDAQGEVTTLLGLGRLAFNEIPKNLPLAQQYFRDALQGSEAIGYIQGEIQACNLLGACALAEDELTTAHESYRRAWKASQDSLSRIASATGLLAFYTRANEIERLHRVVHQILLLIEEGTLPADCAETIVAELSACPAEHVTPEVEQLLQYARRPAVPERQTRRQRLTQPS